jgi:hypothetical protein
MSARASLSNAIRCNGAARPGTIVMEHQAHCRRLLVEAALVTSSDEIRHSMLMRLLAEEEANVLVIPVTMTVVRRAAD